MKVQAVCVDGLFLSSLSVLTLPCERGMHVQMKLSGSIFRRRLQSYVGLCRSKPSSPLSCLSRLFSQEVLWQSHQLPSRRVLHRSIVHILRHPIRSDKFFHANVLLWRKPHPNGLHFTSLDSVTPPLAVAMSSGRSFTPHGLYGSRSSWGWFAPTSCPTCQNIALMCVGPTRASRSPLLFLDTGPGVITSCSLSSHMILCLASDSDAPLRTQRCLESIRTGSFSKSMSSFNGFSSRCGSSKCGGSHLPV